MTTLIILLTAVVLFFSYTIWALKKIGFIPNSWSDGFFELKEKGWTWQLFMVLMGILFFGLTLELLEGYFFQFLGFLVSISVAFVGAAARFRHGTDLESRVHYGFAYLAAGASLALIILSAIYISWIAAVFATVTALICLLWYKYRRNPKTKVFWAEYACFGWTFMLLVYLALQKAGI